MKQFLVKHFRYYLDKFIYIHRCGGVYYSPDEQKCCTENKDKVTCKRCLKILEKETKMAKAKKVTAKKKTSKKK